MKYKIKKLSGCLLIGMMVVLMMSSSVFATSSIQTAGSTEVMPAGTVLMTTPQGKSILIKADSFNVEPAIENRM